MLRCVSYQQLLINLNLGSEQPVPSIGEGIRLVIVHVGRIKFFRAFQGYEALDDESRHIELENALGYNSHSKEREPHSPDDVIFQLDQNGNVYGQKEPHNGDGFNQGFGNPSNNRSGHQNAGTSYEVTRTKKEGSKYPYEGNEDFNNEIN